MTGIIKKDLTKLNCSYVYEEKLSILLTNVTIKGKNNEIGIIAIVI